MNDNELLELAAKSLGIQLYWVDGDVFRVFERWSGNPSEQPEMDCEPWNPLLDDGDALCVAVALKMDILQDERTISIKKWCRVKCESVFLAEQVVEESRQTETRRAIVRAAACIGKAMQEKH